MNLAELLDELESVTNAYTMVTFRADTREETVALVQAVGGEFEVGEGGDALRLRRKGAGPLVEIIGPKITMTAAEVVERLEEANDG